MPNTNENLVNLNGMVLPNFLIQETSVAEAGKRYIKQPKTGVYKSHSFLDP